MDQRDFRENLELKPVTEEHVDQFNELLSYVCLLYTSPSPRDCS